MLDESGSNGKFLRAPKATASDWVARNRAFRRNALLWARSKPCLRLMVLKLAMQAMVGLIHRLLHLGSEDWEKEQELKTARGEQRSYRMAEAAFQNDLKEYFQKMLLLLLRFPPGIRRQDLTASLQVLLFRVVSRAACSMHQLLRQRRNGQPYLLFRQLKEASAWDGGPPCMRDELSTAFYRWYPEYSPGAAVSLESLALAVDLDIAAIESRHAASRRIITSVNQTWAPSMQQVSAEWTLRQMCLRQAETQPLRPDEAEEGIKSQPRRAKRQGQGKQQGAKGGGGGPWRAFIHEMCQGVKLTLSVAREMSAAYRALTPQEMKHYQALGAAGNLAWRHGHASFGERSTVAARTTLQPVTDRVGTVLPDGRMVAADVPRPAELVVAASRDFAEDIRDIRSQFRKLRAEQRQRINSEHAELEAARARALADAPATWSGSCLR